LKTGLRSETSANDEAKPNTERGPKEMAVEHDKVSGARTEATTKAGTSSQWPPNQTVWFPKPDHPILGVSG
jgi:hypothetical protein